MVSATLGSASFTEAGNEKLEQILTEAGLLKGDSLYDVENVTVVHGCALNFGTLTKKSALATGSGVKM